MVIVLKVSFSFPTFKSILLILASSVGSPSPATVTLQLWQGRSSASRRSHIGQQPLCSHSGRLQVPLSPRPQSPASQIQIKCLGRGGPHTPPDTCGGRPVLLQSSKADEHRASPPNPGRLAGAAQGREGMRLGRPARRPRHKGADVTLVQAT